MATASAAYRHERLFKADERKKQWLGRNIHRLDFSSSRQPRDACLRRSGGDCLPELSHMPARVAEKVPTKNRWRPWRLWPDSRLRRERGPRIDRHPMGRGFCLVSSIVGGHMDDDIRRCGGPIGSKRRQKRLSSVNFHGFWPFLSENAADCCRVCCRVSSGYYFLSSSLGLLHEVAQVLSYGP